MPAEITRKFEALEAQAQKLMAAFIKAGHEAVAPSIIQPAGVFLDVIGEQLRARTYVFTDPDGDELCLRPDLTVPTCRLHMERNPDGAKKAKYCYNGPAFRFQPQGAGAAHPREFRQAGIESFGTPDREKADAQTVAILLDALRAAGLKEWKLRIGDLGILRALLQAADMPELHRQRLLHQFWRPAAFRDELKRLSAIGRPATSRLPAALLSSLDPANLPDAEKKIAKYLAAEGQEPVGVRSLTEIAQHLLTRVAEERAEPVKPEIAELIGRYVGVTAPARAAGARLKDIMRERGIDISSALDAYHRRLQMLGEAGVDVVHAEFSAEFGRSLEYYTGFVFEVVVPILGPESPVAGGGRYDRLMKAVGAPDDVPAVGAAIHTERLLTIVDTEAK